MSLHLLSGPPGSGKTHRSISLAREAAQAGERVWWIAPGTQRSYLLRRLTEAGPVLGVDVLTWQQLAYRLLSDARSLKPLLTGSGRLATIGEALLIDRDEPPTPGEARLFATALAEAKAYRVRPGILPGDGPEAERLRRVAHHYEERKGDAWDYDDFRAEAASMLENGPPESLDPLLPDYVIFDGVDELTPADIRLVEALAAVRPVHLSVAVAPPGQTPDEVLPPRDDVTLHRYAFANPVAEARWVLRDVKATLAGGADPLDLALIVPPGRARAVAALAQEYGIPIMDETPRGLADLPEGRRLLDLLDLADAPTPSRLLGVPELRSLGVAALEAGIAGRDALARLAAERGETDAWALWMARLEPLDDPLGWGAELVEAAWASLHGIRGDDDEAIEIPPVPAAFKDEALTRLAEARRVTRPGDDGSHLRGWWSALLQEPFRYERPNAGVALLHAAQALGRHVPFVWILGATEGAHLPRSREDYFIAEEHRASEQNPAAPQLPRRFSDQRTRRADALRARGTVVTLSYPEGDQGGPTTPDLVLLVGEATTPPERPAGSPLDLTDGERYIAPHGPVDLGPPDVHQLARFAQCSLRSWAEQHLRETESDLPDWLLLRRSLIEREHWTEPDLHALATEHPTYAGWLSEHAAQLAAFTYGVKLRDPDTGVQARIDGAQRTQGQSVLLRFTAPGAVSSSDEAESVLEGRPELGWATQHLLTHHKRSVQSVQFLFWPIGSAATSFPERPIERSWSRFDTIDRDVQAALPMWQAGEVRANPGFVCRSCRAFDVCREGQR